MEGLGGAGGGGGRGKSKKIRYKVNYDFVTLINAIKIFAQNTVMVMKSKFDELLMSLRNEFLFFPRRCKPLPKLLLLLLCSLRCQHSDNSCMRLSALH